MQSLDAMKGTLLKLQKAKASTDVQAWLQEVSELRESMITQYQNEKGEEAVRAWGVIKGMNMCLMLVEIYESSIKAQLQSNTHNKIIRPSF